MVCPSWSDQSQWKFSSCCPTPRETSHPALCLTQPIFCYSLSPRSHRLYLCSGFRETVNYFRIKLTNPLTLFCSSLLLSLSLSFSLPTSHPLTPSPSLPLSLPPANRKIIEVKIIDDEEYEKNKSFTIELGEPILLEIGQKHGEPRGTSRAGPHEHIYSKYIHR